MSNDEIMERVTYPLEEPSDTETDQAPDTVVIKMVLEALQQDKTAELKKILKHFYKRILADERDLRYPVITLEEWQEQWKQVMGE
ncbi:hypothetical protein J2S00_002628 [Caldalkalibacillus uzonensis]|uniref:Uncharacterized protein n=1 Tax=Caldalkalibacillus uzonensis TaxID=353224 RepID=A0ABU0CTT6_9BACI|nr:hypothetical protein [Caldalkalibacillus uzonensis]MDQ0339835.1 hypothetical protein [Caldalkalibacillus uzonensis]